MPHILLVDDDRKLGEVLGEYFAQHNFQLSHYLHPKQALDNFESLGIDLIILDVMMPDINGFQVCKRIRKTSQIPILMLTARGEAMDRVVGLELGAEDYLSKPFEPRELIIRIQNIINRNRLPEPSLMLSYKDLSIDQHMRQVMLFEQELKLTNTEYQLLVLLASTPRKNYSRDEILNALKGIEVEIFSRSVDITISRLRKKIAPLDYIKTVWGAGYSFIPEDIGSH